MIDVLSNLEDFGDGEEPWCDLMFKIDRQKSSLFSSSTSLHHAGEWNGKPVAFSSQIDSKDWTFVPAEEEDSVPLWGGVVTLSGDGARGVELCHLWRSYFGIPGTSAFVDGIRCQAVALEGDPTNLKHGVLRTKLFFDNGDPDEYAELYYNLDFDGQYAALNEKDPEYRAPLLKWISGEAGHA